MQTSRAVIERLAEAWFAEARRLRGRGSCDCGCPEVLPLRVRFHPGHDAKLLARYRREIQEILAGQ